MRTSEAKYKLAIICSSIPTVAGVSKTVPRTFDNTQETITLQQRDKELNWKCSASNLCPTLQRFGAQKFPILAQATSFLKQVLLSSEDSKDRLLFQALSTNSWVLLIAWIGRALCEKYLNGYQAVGTLAIINIHQPLEVACVKQLQIQCTMFT